MGTYTFFFSGDIGTYCRAVSIAKDENEDDDELTKFSEFCAGILSSWSKANAPLVVINAWGDVERPLDEKDFPGKKEDEEGDGMLFSKFFPNGGGDVGAYFGEVG